MDVKHLSQLSNIPLTEEEVSKLAEQFEATLEVVDQLNQLDTKSIQPTPQVIQTENVLRTDSIDEGRVLAQEAALSNASRTYRGYFVVPVLLAHEA